MKITNIIKSLPWKNSNGAMQLSGIDTVVVHHDAEYRPLSYNSLNRYKRESTGHIAKGWGHISYHYIIDNTGEVFQCLPEDEVGYHCGNLAINRKSIAIKLDGNMEGNAHTPAQQPTAKQVESYKKLMNWLTTQRPDLPKVLEKSVKGHRDIKATACPGKTLYPLIHQF
jgi:N-acetyl-anhydromuramyl-L-alanine amidase AmpD